MENYNKWIRILSISVIAVLVAAGNLSAAANTLFECEEILIGEVESANIHGDWEVETSVSNYTGDAYIRWDGPDNWNYTQAGDDVIFYDFVITNEGRYNFRIRNHHDHPDSTLENDVWVRILDANNQYVIPCPNYPANHEGWIKVFSGTKNQWTWASNHECSDSNKPPAHYDFAAGNYTLEFSGRSYNFRMDRFHFYKNGHPDAQNITLGETTFDCTPPLSGSGSNSNEENPGEETGSGEESGGGKSNQGENSSSSGAATFGDDQIVAGGCGMVATSSAWYTSIALVLFAIVALWHTRRNAARV